MVSSEEVSLAKQYGVKSFPSFYILKQSEKKPIKFDEDVFTYKRLFEWINIYSETFVFKGADETVESSASKPWLSQPMPYLSKESANDICLKKDGILCVMYVVKDKSASDDKVLEAFKNIQDRFTSKLERGITFSYVRLDMTAEADFAGALNLEGDQVPGLVILNPGKKKRFMVSEYDLTEEGITQTLDKILGGDARFKMISGNKLPEFTQEHAFFTQ